MALTLLFVLLALLLVVVLWAVFVEPYRLSVTHHQVALPNLPPAWQGKTVALLADFQVGMVWHNLATIRRAVKLVLAFKPAAVLIAGDFVHQPPESLEPSLKRVTELLGPLLRAGLPVYGVLGNHDYGIGVSQREGQAYAKRVEEALEAAGVRILSNEALPMTPPEGGAPLHLVGIGDHQFEQDDPARALAGLDGCAPRIVMMHDPRSFDKVPAGAAPLAVAGHTHGGQVRLPVSGNRYWLVPKGKGQAHLAGWVEGGQDNLGQPGNRLYITRGIGYSVVPMRLFSPPELTLFTLRAAGGPLAAHAGPGVRGKLAR